MPKFGILVAGALAIGSHGGLLYKWIDLSVGQNLTSLNLLSFVIWVIACLTIIVAIKKPVENILLFIIPLAILSIILAALFPSSNIIDTAANPKQLLHILLSTLAFSVLSIAALQALLLAIQDWLLRHHRLGNMLQVLPPLETMEVLLFQIISIGFLLLTIVLITSLISYHPIFHSYLLHKTLLSLFAWAIFAILLCGRYLLGWRGRLAIRWTLGGVIVVILAYFGSQLAPALLAP